MAYSSFCSRAAGYVNSSQERALLEAYASSQGYELVAVYADPDSAVDPREREGLQQLLTHALRRELDLLLVPSMGTLSVEEEHQRGLELELQHEDVEVLSLGAPRRRDDQAYRAFRAQLAVVKQCARWGYPEQEIRAVTPGEHVDREAGFSLDIPFGFVRFVPGEREDRLYLLRRTIRNEVVTFRVRSGPRGKSFPSPEDDEFFSAYLAELRPAEFHRDERISVADSPSRNLVYTDPDGTWFREVWVARPELGLFVQGAASAGMGELARVQRMIDGLVDTLSLHGVKSRLR